MGKKRKRLVVPMGHEDYARLARRKAGAHRDKRHRREGKRGRAAARKAIEAEL